MPKTTTLSMTTTRLIFMPERNQDDSLVVTRSRLAEKVALYYKPFSSSIRLLLDSSSLVQVAIGLTLGCRSVKGDVTATKVPRPMEVLDLFHNASFTILLPKFPTSLNMLSSLVLLSSVLACAAAHSADSSAPSGTVYTNEPAQQAPLVSDLGLAPQRDVHEPGPDDPLNLAKDSAFMGLMTYANIPYVHCLADEAGGEEYKGEKYDIAVLGAPFDTVSE